MPNDWRGARGDIVFYLMMCVNEQKFGCGVLCFRARLCVRSMMMVFPLIAAVALEDGHVSGMLTVNSSVGTLSTFHYFIKHPNPSAPMIVWMNGGPGASSLMGLYTELGPLLFNDRSRGNGTFMPSSNPYAWSRLGSLLVWEQPAGVGFSRCVSGCPKVWNDTTSAIANAAFLRTFYRAHPAEAKRRLIISGESYGGIYVPLLASRVLRDPTLRSLGVHLGGIAVGDGCIGYAVSGGCGADSMDVFVSVLERVAPGVARARLSAVRRDCSVAELTTGKQPEQLSQGCGAAMKALFEEVGEYNVYHWASPCGARDALASGQGNWGDGSSFSCDGKVLAEWLALPATQLALGAIQPGDAPKTWQMWDGDSDLYNITEADAQPAYREVLASGAKILIYSGLSDTGVPDVGTQRYLPRIAGTAVSAPRRKWGQPPHFAFAGHVTAYASGLTYVTVAGAGHLVPADRPIAALAMMEAWVAGTELPAYRGAKCSRLWLGRGWGKFC